MKDKSCRDKCQAVQVVEDAAEVVPVAVIHRVGMVGVTHRMDHRMGLHMDIRLLGR
jgi:hypothetical protein